jgi:hypothetical protein
VARVPATPVTSKRRFAARSEAKPSEVGQWPPRRLRLVARVPATPVTSKRRFAARSEPKPSESNAVAAVAQRLPLGTQSPGAACRCTQGNALLPP